jgi:hypothetical protein
MSDKPDNIALSPIVVCDNCETTQKQLEEARQRLAILEKLFYALEDYCVNDELWRNVEAAWEQAR